jgi:hypothetical protein
VKVETRDPTAALDQILDADNKWEIHFINNLVKNTKAGSSLAYQICSSLEATEFFGRNNVKTTFPQKPKRKNPLHSEAKAFAYPDTKQASNAGADPRDWAFVTEYFEKASKKFKPDSPKSKDTVHRNIETLGKALGMSRAAIKCMAFFYLNANFSHMFDNLSRSIERKNLGLLIARTMDDTANADQYVKMLNQDESPLFKYGFLHFVGEMDSFPRWDFTLINRFRSMEMTQDQIISMILGEPAETVLELKDFDYLGGRLNILVKNLERAIERGDKGVCAFIHGEQGLGKTELAKAIAKHLDKKLYSIGEKKHLKLAGQATPNIDEDGEVSEIFDEHEGGTDKGDKASRLAQLLRAQRLLGDSDDSIVMLDEPEDLVPNPSDSAKRADPQSKLDINRAFERNRVPIILCGNDPPKFHTAVRDRMGYSIEMKPMPTKVRKKIWERQIELQGGLDLTEKEVLSFARKYDAAPRMIRMALENYARTGDKNAIHETMRASSTIVKGSPLAVETGSVLTDDFDPALINISAGASAVEALTNAVRNHKPAAILIRAEPGFGTEELLEFVAEQASAHIDAHHCGNLAAEISNAPPPEARVRIAFSIAEGERSLLVIREPKQLTGMADAPHIPDAAWESSLVQTFERAAIKFKGPLVMVVDPETKLPDNLSALFTDTVVLSAMNAAQAKLAFGVYLGKDRKVPTELLARVDGLVIEDFVRTRRRVEMLEQSGRAQSGSEIVHILQEERDIREGRYPNSGFGFGGLRRPASETSEPVPLHLAASHPDKKHPRADQPGTVETPGSEPELN